MKRIKFIIAGLLIASGTAFAQNAQQQTEIDKIAQLAKTNPTAATEQGKDLIKQDKKNLDLIIAVGRVFVNAEKPAEATLFLDMAKKVKANCAKTNVFAGDIEVAKNDPGTACQMYETAIYYEPKEEAAYLRYADIYKGIDPEGAVAKLKTLKEKRPDLTNVDLKIGEVYYTSNKFDEAIATYSAMDLSKIDEKGLQNYAFALFMNHQFDKSEDIANAGLQKNPRSAAFNRLAMYNNTDLKNYEAAEKYATNLFTNSDKAEFSYLDYTYYGYALVGAKKYAEAIEQFKKALALDNSRTDVIKALSDAYVNVEDYGNAATTYKQYLSKLDNKDLTPDKVFQLGRIYSMWGTDDKKSGAAFAAEKKNALEEADSAFAKVAEMAPDSYLGNFYRARANSSLDPDQSKGLAKPYYEKAIEIMTSKGDIAKYSKQLIEAYQYLGYYYYNKKMMADSKSCYQKILSIDPSNKIGKDGLLMFK
jgi:tetratricopeptide (TPR) repeat protein